jgi:uncharacterized protein YdiU (UPF0061 family)
MLKNNNSKEKSIDLMKMSNPTVIPRNHKVEEALNSVNEGNLEILNKLLSVLKKPYSSQETIGDYQLPSTNNSYQTFCGT